MILKTGTKVIKKVETGEFQAERFAESHKFVVEMKIKYALFAIGAVCLSAGCKTTEEVAEDSAASAMLTEARELLSNKSYAAARDTILSIRRKHPTALEVRRAAILTLDSVELMATRDSMVRFEDSLNTLKQRFQAMKPRVNGRTNEAYYEAQRRIFEMQQHFDELCAKAKFYVRKIDIDRENAVPTVEK